MIGSISGWKPRTTSSYAVAKAAEIHLAPALAVELARERIRVNTLSPGSVMFEGGRWAHGPAPPTPRPTTGSWPTTSPAAGS